MEVRFQKRIRIFKGLTLNLSKSGTSWWVGAFVKPPCPPATPYTVTTGVAGGSNVP
jgi:hypothetical protein